MLKEILRVPLIFITALLIVFIQSCKVEEEAKVNTPPTTDFTVEPETGPASALFTFKASGCKDDEDSPTVLQVRWDWENNAQWDTDWTTDKVSTHQYGQEGIYNIKLEVKDTEGLTGSVTHQLTVTPANTPLLLTSDAFAIQQNTALCDGTITDDGGLPITAKGFCWSLDAFPTIDGAHSDEGSGSGDFTGQLTTLNANTAYYVRSYATNQNGTGYGNQRPFTTQSGEFGDPCDGISVVDYEGQTYHATQIGSQCWFRENLNVGARIDGLVDQSDNGIIEKFCYWDEPAFCDTFGAVYQWGELMQYASPEGGKGICPEGWHVPTRSEWTTLVNFCGNFDNASAVLKDRGTEFWLEPSVSSDLYGFTALGAGIFSRDVPQERPYCCRRYQVQLWSSTRFDTENSWYYQLENYWPYVKEMALPDLGGAYVRCIKD